MNEGLIPNRYAKALYKYAREHGVAEAIYEEMKRFDDAFKTLVREIKKREAPKEKPVESKEPKKPKKQKNHKHGCIIV